MKAQFTRKPGSVFLTPDPVTIPNVTHIGDRFKHWVNVANEMVAEVEATPELTPEATPEPVSQAALGNPADVRIYRESSGKRTKIWEGTAPHNINTWCQSQADTSGCLITMHDAESVKHFHPEKGRESDDAPPISDKMKSEVEPKPSTHLQDLLAEVDAIMSKGEQHA